MKNNESQGNRSWLRRSAALSVLSVAALAGCGDGGRIGSPTRELGFTVTCPEDSELAIQEINNYDHNVTVACLGESALAAPIAVEMLPENFTDTANLRITADPILDLPNPSIEIRETDAEIAFRPTIEIESAYVINQIPVTMAG